MRIGRVDPSFYRNLYPDLMHLSDAQLVEHYYNYGIAEGRLACPEGVRDGFIDLIPRDRLVLEIGPFANPALRGANVRYADVLSTEQLKERALQHGLQPDSCPEIHYVLPDLDLAKIPEKFDTIISSHCIEHQPDLVRHLHAIEELLSPGGRYFVIVPDRRFCFDHFIPESSIADVVSAHLRKPRVHDVGSVIEHWALTTHNDTHRHWQGDHGRQHIEESLAPLEGAIREYQADPSKYIDVHAWQFIPYSFYKIIDLLGRMGWILLKPIVVFPTVRPRNEFCAVLGEMAPLEKMIHPSAIARQQNALRAVCQSSAPPQSLNFDEVGGSS